MRYRCRGRGSTCQQNAAIPPIDTRIPNSINSEYVRPHRRYDIVITGTEAGFLFPNIDIV